MRCTFIFTLIAAVSSVVAAPLSADVSPSRYAGLSKRNCNPMPSKVDNNMVDIVYRTVRTVSKEHKVMSVTFATCITESLFNNLDCGDQDSLGLFQQRASKGWGTPAQLQDPVYATKKFLEVLMPLYRANPGLPVNVLAQNVQRAEAGDQYYKVLGMAEQLIREAAARAGNSGNDDDSNDQPTSTKTPPKTATGNGNGGVVNVGGKPTSSAPAAPQPTSEPTDEEDTEDCDDSVPECEEYDVPVAGDNCYKVASRHGLTLAQFYQLNAEIDENCQNLYAGKQYCVAAADVVKRSF